MLSNPRFGGILWALLAVGFFIPQIQALRERLVFPHCQQKTIFKSL